MLFPDKAVAGDAARPRQVTGLPDNTVPDETILPIEHATGISVGIDLRTPRQGEASAEPSDIGRRGSAGASPSLAWCWCFKASVKYAG